MKKIISTALLMGTTFVQADEPPYVQAEPSSHVQTIHGDELPHLQSVYVDESSYVETEASHHIQPIHGDERAHLQSVYVDESTYFGYGDIHSMGGFFPMIGIGVRSKKNFHGFDISANACPLNPPSSLSIYHLKALYLAYPGNVGFYLGAGLGFLNEPIIMNKLSASAEIAIGWQSSMQRKGKMFFELNAVIPVNRVRMADSKTIIRIWPGLTLGYGF